MPAPEGCCADCWCERGSGDTTPYCHHCLLARLQAGERVALPEHPAFPGWVSAPCSRCAATGVYLVSATQEGAECWRCGGSGLISERQSDVRRAARWSATFQSNREIENE